MNKILEKFIKKVEKNKNWGILYRDKTEILISIPIEFPITLHYKNILSSHEHRPTEPRKITSCILFTTDPKSQLAITCTKSNIVILQLINNELADESIETIEEILKEKLMKRYDLYTQKGDGH